MLNQTTAFLLFLLILSACRGAGEPEHFTQVAENQRSEFNQYWYNGKAEISSYDLLQLRYGEYREGEAVIIFVTEDIHPKTHIKLDNPEADGAEKVKVMKMNMMRNFTTGIYPYSMMLSVFHPFDDAAHPATLKASMSSQEWCGHVFNQVNYTGNSYRVSTNSYFENTGDQQFNLEKSFLEDALWIRLKVNPDEIPAGEGSFIPGLFHTRASHQSLGPLNARSSWTETDTSKTFHLEYTDRKLSIELEPAFPYQILGWEEFRFEGTDQTLISRGTLRKSIVTDYWNLNSKADEIWRDSLGL